MNHFNWLLHFPAVEQALAKAILRRRSLIVTDASEDESPAQACIPRRHRSCPLSRLTIGGTRAGPMPVPKRPPRSRNRLPMRAHTLLLSAAFEAIAGADSGIRAATTLPV